jgi:photosystem II stability/assembly factor-like uncharacterized protein
MVRFATLLLVSGLLAASAAGQVGGVVSGPWVMEQSGTTAGLRGIHAVDANVAWASGTGGTILRTVDGGATWQRCATPPGAEKLDFRGIWAWDAQTAIAMSSGPGDLSRLYKTVDGCGTWKLVFTNPDKDGFWDAMQCFDSRSCYLLGDPTGGEFQLFHTEDGGARWVSEHDRAPHADSSFQGVFAASNSALGLGTETVFTPFFGSGGKGGAFFYRSMGVSACSDGCTEHNSPARSEGWLKVGVPVNSGGESAGIFSLAFRDTDHGMAVGGDYSKPNDSAGTAAWSADGGKSWTAAAKPPHGFRSTDQQQGATGTR